MNIDILTDFNIYLELLFLFTNRNIEMRVGLGDNGIHNPK